LCAATSRLAWSGDGDVVSHGGKSADAWIEVLKANIDSNTDEAKEQSRQAAAALGQIGPAAKDAVSLLDKATWSMSPETRYFAVDALGRIGPAARESVPTIIEQMIIPEGDPSYYEGLGDFRRLAAKAFGRMGPAASDAVPTLEKALQSGDLVYRVEAALALWKIARHKDAVPTLESIIKRGGDPGRYEAIMALLEVGPEAESATDTLVSALALPDPDVRRAAAKVLARLGPSVLEPVEQLLSAGNLESPESAAYVLGEVLAELRETTFYNRQLDQAAFQAAARPVFVSVAPGLVGLLSHEREDVRQVASQSLAQMGIVAAWNLTGILKGSAEDERVRQGAIDTLLRLEQYLPGESPSSVGVEFIKGKLVAPLMALMEHPRPEVRAAAYRAFAAFSFGEDGKAALPLLLKALKDPNVSIRRYATKARDELLKKQASHPTN